MTSHGAPPPPDRPPRDGGGYFALLAGAPMRALLLALRPGPLSRGELLARRGVAERTMRKRLEDLERMGLVARRALAEDRRASEYELTQAGGELATIAAELEALAATPGAGSAFIEAITGRRRRLILRGLLDASLTTDELLRIVPGLSHTTLSRDLAILRAGGLVRERQAGGPHGASVHELTPLAAECRRLLLLSAHWRWRWTPFSAPWIAGDLAALVHLIAPLVVLEPSLRGRVELHVEPPPRVEIRGWPDVEVSAAAGRISVVDFGATARPDARVEAQPRAWCEAFCGEGLGGLRIEGDGDLAEAVLTGLVEGLGR